MMSSFILQHFLHDGNDTTFTDFMCFVNPLLYCFIIKFKCILKIKQLY